MVVRIAGCVSIVWLVVLSTYAILSPPLFVRMWPNEVGDFLAGAFAPLAFVWIGVTVWLQHRQLAAQNEALNQTSTALQLQSRQLQDSIDLMKQAGLVQQLDRICDRLLLGILRTVKISEDNILIRSPGGVETSLGQIVGRYRTYSEFFRGKEIEMALRRFSEGFTEVVAKMRHEWVLDAGDDTVEEVRVELTALDQLAHHIMCLSIDIRRFSPSLVHVSDDVLTAFRQSALEADAMLGEVLRCSDEA